jgi:hypothetical protein
MPRKRRIGKKKHIRGSRSTKTYLETHEEEKNGYKTTVIDAFNKKPLSEKHEPSTHYVVDDNKKTAWPSITEDGKGGYKEQSYKEALNAGEAYKFLTRKRMIDFARKGNWKDGYKK